MSFKKEDFPRLYKIYSESELAKGNITKTCQIYCAENNIEYTDQLRRSASRIINWGIVDTNIQFEGLSQAKILLFDIETSPILARVWSLWQNGINIDDIVEDWSILCFSAKWLFSDEIISFRLSEEELKTKDDRRIVKELWNLLDRADIVIAHNAERFDIKKSNAKFIKHEYNLPSPYQVIDTLRHAKRKMNFTSNKLDYIARYLGVEGKMVTPSGMWRKVMEGDYSMLIEMDTYCQQDVICLEQVYLKMRPFIQPHPNIGLHIADNIHSCPSCGSLDLNWDKNNIYTTNSSQYHAFRCNSCKSLGRSRASIIKAKDKTNLTVPNAR